MRHVRPFLILAATAAACPAADVWVTGGDFIARRYSTVTGDLLQTLPVPYDGPRPPADTIVRGTTVDHAGRLVVFNGSSSPQISTYDPTTDTWTHRIAPNLNAGGNVAGSVATVGSYQFAADRHASSATSENGIVRFNTSATETVRFNNTPTSAGNTLIVTRGHDGLLYALADLNSPRTNIWVYNPYSLARIRTISFTGSVASLAVGPTGEFYASSVGPSADNPITAFAPDGTRLRSLNRLTIGLDLAADGSLIAGTFTSGVHLTTTALTSSTQIIPYTGTSQQFVSFATPAPQRGWRPASGSMAGTFSDPANWTGPVPGSALGDANSIAVFSARPPFSTSAAYTLTIDAPVTLGTIALDSPHAHVLTGTQPITLAVPAGQRAFIDVAQGDHTLRAPVTLASDLTVHTAPGASLFLSTPTVGGPTTRLDLASHNLIWDYAPSDPSPLRNLRRALRTGYMTAGTANPPGMFSSTANADPTGTAAIGYAEASDLGLTSFAGQPVDASAIVFLLTRFGDTNLDGAVDADDYARLDRGDALDLTGWLNGDFDYDGVITANDYLLIDKTRAHQQGGTLSPAFLAERAARFGPAYVSALLTSIPEPSALACLFAMLPPLTRRPRRRAE